MVLGIEYTTAAVELQTSGPAVQALLTAIVDAVRRFSFQEQHDDITANRREVQGY
jgi:hypothetical protein